MDKRAALKAAAAAVVAFLIPFLILAGLVYLALAGRLWARVVLAVILVGVFGRCCYNVFKD